MSNNNGNNRTMNTALFFQGGTDPEGRVIQLVFCSNLRIPKSMVANATISETSNGHRVMRFNAPFNNVKEKFLQATGVEPFEKDGTSWIQLNFWDQQIDWFRQWALKDGMPATIEIAPLCRWNVSSYKGNDGSDRTSIGLTVLAYGRITRRIGQQQDQQGEQQNQAQNQNQQRTQPPQQNSQHAPQQVPAGIMDDFQFTDDDGELPF